MEISAKHVKELREKTGAGMMDCKNALVEAKGDMEQAIIILRKKGLASAQIKPRELLPKAWLDNISTRVENLSFW